MADVLEFGKMVIGEWRPGGEAMHGRVLDSDEVHERSEREAMHK